MLILFLALYTLFIVFVWWFFVIAKIHAYKFKNFSNNIEKTTNILFVCLWLLSVIWYFVILSFDNSNVVVVDTKAEKYTEIYY